MIENKKLRFNYQTIEKYQAGIVLEGTEVRSLRENKGSLVDSFCYFKNNELFIKNFQISCLNTQFKYHDEKRDKKLLLTKKELKKLKKESEKPGYSIIPECVLVHKGLYKVIIWLCKGKKEYDKREAIKQRDLQRELKI